MRDMNDLKNAFGKADAGFVSNVYQTLASLQASEKRRTVKRSGFRLAAAIAVVCILSTITVLAATNTWGILDFITGRGQARVLPEAADMVQKDVAQSGGQTGFGSFEVREAIFDGKNVYLVIDVKPSNLKYLLLGPDASPLDPIGSLGPSFSDKSGTIEEYANDNHLEMINTSVGISGVNSVDYLLNEDGTLVYMLNGSYASSSLQATIEVDYAMAPFVRREGKMAIDAENIQRSTFLVALDNSGVKAVATSTAPAAFNNFGVQVDKVTLFGSSMAVYADIEYSVIDDEKFARAKDGLWFDFVDERGNVLPSGAALWGGVEAFDETHFIQRTTLQAAEALPAEISLRCFDFSEKDRYETQTLEMK